MKNWNLNRLVGIIALIAMVLILTMSCKKDAPAVEKTTVEKVKDEAPAPVKAEEEKAPVEKTE